ncbi:NifX-associated nitrogen fixation protein [Phaeospirillum tilakii]|uniref:NifX-associated nitrogen fixation protein n=1 Tax=Phaeospirillum tilakii TaxID=741673 RepID=A0ABW5CBM4_9PROT
MAEPQSIPEDPFLKSLLMLIRAHDGSGAWEAMPDAEVIAPFIVTKEQRREIPLIGDPDPDILWRVELYYSAIGLAIEQRTGFNAAPIMKIHHEGWGRMLLTAGRLVVVNSYLRDLHRFGFDSPQAMIDKAAKIIDGAVAVIERFPEAAAAS